MSRYSASHTYASLFAPTNPPKPIDIAPAINSASPPNTTSLALPKAERPAVSANGTVRPSDKPRMASEMTLGLTFSLEACCFDARSSSLCNEAACASMSFICVSCCKVPRPPVNVTSVVASEFFLDDVCPSFVSEMVPIAEDQVPRVASWCWTRDARMVTSLISTRSLRLSKEGEEEQFPRSIYVICVFMILCEHAKSHDSACGGDNHIVAEPIMLCPMVSRKV
jgi:hypothetical protein